MTDCLLLLAPSANRVYASATADLAVAEMEITFPEATDVEKSTIAGIDYLSFRIDNPGAEQLARIARQSASLALFAQEGELLRPTQLPRVLVLDEDLVTIPKYRGKTNELFTRLLVNVTESQVLPRAQQLNVLDPMAGRGTTLLTAWLLGHNAYGVEEDEKSFEAMAAYVKTWCRRKRLKHTADVTPVRREGRSIGRRFDAKVKIPDQPDLTMTVFTGDTTSSAALFGKKKFDVIATDAPYGVVHGAVSNGNRRRSPKQLLEEAVPIWASQLRETGALGISWNTYGLAREELAQVMEDAGLVVQDSAAWRRLEHRVDSSINRAVLVGRHY